MKLYYDEMAKTFSLQTDGGVEFLGPQKHTMLKLQELGLSIHQSQAATIQAVMNSGIPVCLSTIKIMTAGFRKVK